MSPVLAGRFFTTEPPGKPRPSSLICLPCPTMLLPWATPFLWSWAGEWPSAIMVLALCSSSSRDRKRVCRSSSLLPSSGPPGQTFPPQHTQAFPCNRQSLTNCLSDNFILGGKAKASGRGWSSRKRSKIGSAPAAGWASVKENKIHVYYLLLKRPYPSHWMFLNFIYYLGIKNLCTPRWILVGEK